METVLSSPAVLIGACAYLVVGFFLNVWIFYFEADQDSFLYKIGKILHQHGIWGFDLIPLITWPIWLVAYFWNRSKGR